ncbi:MAG TPA: hypothetical protein VER79_04015, partial [Candidatus Limnocylindrales bacterium]|nr:hypothetical protein [Candidatus Limnocylindrales bacterium]
RSRRAADKRVQSALSRAGVGNPAKPKHAVEAPWWNEDYDEDKPKRILLEEEELLRVDDDGELPDGLEQHKRNQMSRGA